MLLQKTLLRKVAVKQRQAFNQRFHKGAIIIFQKFFQGKKDLTNSNK